MRRNPTPIALAALALAAACGGDGAAGTMSVHLVDAPTTDYGAIHLDIRRVEIHRDAGWVTLGTPNKVVDLLSLTGGVAETLANGTTLPAGHYDQLRLLLGDGNTVTLPDETVQDLKVPSGLQSGVKLNVSFDVAPGTTRDVWIDFDAHRSVFVHEAGNSGKYLLRPVITAVDRLVTGSVTGKLTTGSPAVPLAGATVMAEAVTASGPVVVRTVTTGLDGSYALDLLPVGVPYYVVTQPVVGGTAYLAKASAAVTLSDALPVATYDAQLTPASEVGSLSGTITPPVGTEETDTVALVQSLDVGAVLPQPLVVRTALGAYEGTGETYAFASLPAGPYSARVTRSSDDGSGGVVLQSGDAAAVTVGAAPATLALTAP